MDKTLNINQDSFDEKVLKSSKLVLVDFWADWCGPCRSLAPKLEEISKEDEKVQIIKINVDENHEIAAKYGIRGIPAMLFFKNGNLVGELVGNQPKDSITEAINHYSSK